MAIDPDTGAMKPVSGEGVVLGVSTAWGEIPFVMGSKRTASLVIDLSEGLEDGASMQIGGLPVEFREENEQVSKALSGTLTVVRREASWVTLRADVLVDTKTGGEPIRIAGETRVARGHGPSCASSR